MEDQQGNPLKYIDGGRLIFIPAAVALNKLCSHSRYGFADSNIDGKKYRHCKGCGMVAHEDGNYSYCCGIEWCRCITINMELYGKSS